MGTLKKIGVSGLIALLLAMSATTQVHATSVVSGTIRVGNEPEGMAFDSAKGEIFVANAQSSSLSVILDFNNTVIATVSLPSSPSSVVYDSAKGEIFAANYATPGYVYVISDSTNKVVGTVNLQAGPMAYNPNKGEIYSSSGSSLTIISDKTNAVVDTINTNGTLSYAGGLAYDSGTSTVYLVNSQGDASGILGSMAVISDPSGSTSSSSPTPTATSSTGNSASSSPTSTPKAPEFSSPALALIAAALVAATLCTFTYSRKKQHAHN